MNKKKDDNKQQSLFNFFKRKTNNDEIVVENENESNSLITRISSYIRNKSSSFLNKLKNTTASSTIINKSNNKTISLASINEKTTTNKNKNVTHSVSSIVSNNLLNHAQIDNDDDPAQSSNIHKNTSEPCRPSIELIKKGDPKSRFTKSMYDKYGWLEYSLTSKKVFCFNCRMFGFESMEPAWVISNYFIL